MARPILSQFAVSVVDSHSINSAYRKSQENSSRQSGTITSNNAGMFTFGCSCLITLTRWLYAPALKN